MFASYLNMLARSLIKYYAIILILIKYYESIIHFLNYILISKSINLKFKLERLFKFKFWVKIRFLGGWSMWATYLVRALLDFFFGGG